MWWFFVRMHACIIWKIDFYRCENRNFYYKPAKKCLSGNSPVGFSSGPAIAFPRALENLYAIRLPSHPCNTHTHAYTIVHHAPSNSRLRLQLCFIAISSRGDPLANNGIYLDGWWMPHQNDASRTCAHGVRVCVSVFLWYTIQIAPNQMQPTLTNKHIFA